MFSLFSCHCSHLTNTTLIITITVCPTTIRHSAHSRNCLVRSSHATWHKTAYITTDCYPLYLPLLYTYVFRLQNGLNVEGSWSCLLEISNAKACVCAFSYQLFPHTYCCWFRCSMYLLGCICVHITVRLCCVCVIHLSYTHTDVIVGLLIYSSIYMCTSVPFVLFFSCER